MPVKNTQQTITSILNAFRNDLNKVAEEAPEDAVIVATEEGEEESCPVQEAAEEFSEAVENAEDSGEKAVAAAETLKNIAQDYIDNHDEALKKEAAVFGEIFADAFAARMDALQKTASEDALLEKMAAIYDEAYLTVLQKLAGDPETSDADGNGLDDHEEQHESVVDAVNNAALAAYEAAAASHLLADHIADTDPATDDHEYTEEPEGEEENGGEEEGEDAPEGISPEAYQQLLAAIAASHGEGAPEEEGPAPDDDTSGIEQDAYNAAMARLQQQGA